MPNGFANNWAYLKTELNWLERVLMVAVSRQRQEQKSVNRAAQSQADRVSAHWWKGLVSLEGKVAYDEHRPPSSAPAVGYQQQLQNRIQASRQNGVVLLLPLLCDRLQLTLFEKNLILMAIAPEVNRRYGRLYQYLQGSTDSELPTLELALRLMCRNDSDWQTARRRISDRSPLLQYHLIQLVRPSGGTFLNATVRVLPRLVELLLSEASAPELETLLQETRGASAPIQPAATLPVQFSAPSRNVNQSGLAANAGNAPQMSSAAKAEPPVSPPTTAPEAASKAVQSATWEDLILPSALIAELKHLSDRLRVQSIVDDQWEFKQQNFGAIQPGRVALLVGDAGTGKTMAARAVASAANGPLVIHDLALLSPSRWSAVIETLMTSCPPVLLIKSAQRWFGPQSKLAGLEELIAQRQQRPTLTLLSTHQLEVVGLRWRRRLDRTLRFPQPDEGDRLQLWKQAFPKAVTLGRLRWSCLATLPLTGGEIAALAREAAILAAAESSERIMQRHMTAALNRQGYRLPKQEK